MARIVKRHILVLALRVAAEQYAQDAAVHAKEPAGGEGLMSAEGRQRMVDGFEHQALDAIDLAIALDRDGVQIELED